MHFHESMEIYNIQTNSWHKGPNLNIGREHHSSCGLDQWAYIFGGIDKDWNSLNSLERVFLKDGQAQGSWELIRLKIILSRKWSAMCQLSKDEIMIVGGVYGYNQL